MNQIMNLVYIKELAKHDKANAIILLTELCDNDNNECMIYMNSLDISTYFQNIIFSDEQIDYFAKRSYKYIYSTWILGCLYIHMSSITDYEKAYSLIKWSYENGCIRATASLGSIYYNGFGVEKNNGKAFLLFKESSEQGCPIGLEGMAYIYHFGNGVQQDYVKAAELYGLASNYGCSGSTYNLGVMYWCGNGVEQDYVKAIQLYTTAIKLGNINATDSLMKLCLTIMLEKIHICFIKVLIQEYSQTNNIIFANCIKIIIEKYLYKLNNNPDTVSENIIELLQIIDLKCIYGDDIPDTLLRLQKMFLNYVEI